MLSERAGDIIARHTHLFALVGSTETGTLIQHATDPEDWQYVYYNTEYNGIEWRSRGELYELVLRKNNDLLDVQGVFKLYPRMEEYSMSDLYSKHPTKQHHWKHEGRTDDMIVLKSGWNFNPIRHEALIASHEIVQNCILVGTGRNVPVAIIELRSDINAEQEEIRQAVLAELTPKIDEANSFADSAGQLRKDAILFAKKDKPFAIAGKGTVQKKATASLYEEEIEELYLSLGNTGRIVL